jgi:hypothetical protein
VDTFEVQWNPDLILHSLMFSFELCALSMLCFISTLCLYVTVDMCQVSSVSRLDDIFIPDEQDFFFPLSRKISSGICPVCDPVSISGFALGIKWAKHEVYSPPPSVECIELSPRTLWHFAY